MGKSSGIPYFNGSRIAHSGFVANMAGSVSPIVKVYPRNIGAVIKGAGAVQKTITLECNVIPPSDSGRSAVENFMNAFNEEYGTVVGDLVIDDNTYKDCGIDSIDYDETITDGFLKYTIQFSLGVQSEDDTVSQLVPGNLFYDSRGRIATFTNIPDDDSEESKTFTFVHNVDIVRNLENRLVVGLYDKFYKDSTVKFNGGVETIKAICWMKAPEVASVSEDKASGWKQTVGAYIYDIMNGPMGDIGNLVVGSNTIDNVLFVGVNLTEVFPTSARYEMTFLTSLQC